MQPSHFCKDPALEAPITALCCPRWSDDILFASGNSLHRHRLHSKGVEGELTARAPNGVVLSAIGRSNTHVLAAAADCVYCIPIDGVADPDNNSLRPVLRTCGGRVLCIVYDRASLLFVVVTADNKAFTVSQEAVATAYTQNTVCSQVMVRSGPGTAVVLAADALVEANDRCSIFTATYAGSVSLWSFRVREQPSSDDFAPCADHSKVPAHRPGCAILAIQALQDSAGYYVATCSDDRTATLYHASELPQTNSPSWRLLWRGEGSSFSRGRVFDVCLWASSTRPVLFYGVGSADGSIQVVEVALCGGTEGPPARYWYRAEQHSGLGTFRVGFAPPCDRATEPPLLISGGFDGTICATRWSMDSDDATQFCHCAVVSGERRKIRGVHVDGGGRTLYCTESEVVALDTGFPAPTVLRSFNLHKIANGMWPLKLLRPTCITTVTEGPLAIALVGTEGGHLFVLTYLGRPADPWLATVWSGHHKVLAMKAVSIAQSLGCCDASSSTKLVVLSSHSDNSVRLSVVDDSTVSTVARCCGCSGLQTVSFGLVYRDADNCAKSIRALVGDKKGALRSYELDLSALGAARLSDPRDLQPVTVTQIFPPSLSVALLDMTLCNGTTSVPVNVFSIDGNYGRVDLVSLEGTATGAEIPIAEHPLLQCPLRFPHKITVCLAVSSSCLVAQFGTSVSVYRRTPQVHTWRRVATYLSVKAPRLIAAAIIEGEDGSVRAVMSHCSDGVHIEGHQYTTTAEGATDTSILHGGLKTGKDFNCTVFHPAPLACFLHGSEDSSVVVDVGGPASTSPTTLVGPHQSNILAMACMPPPHTGAPAVARVVTTGGLATVAVWEWTPVTDWRVVNSKTDTSDLRGRADYSQYVPRYLSVLPVDAETVVAGGSDGLLRVLRLSPRTERNTPNDTLRCVMSFPLNRVHPKPIMALGTLHSEGAAPMRFVAGDTNGVLYVLLLTWSSDGDAQLTVEAQQRLEQSAVNAITQTGYTVQRPSGNSSTFFASLHDSGILHFVEVTGSSNDVTVMTPLAAMPTGVTAGRGVVWPGLNEPLYAVNDERVLRLCVTPDVFPFMQVVSKRRVNVRCVSGMAVGARDFDGRYQLTVVGQGTERFLL